MSTRGAIAGLLLLAAKALVLVARTLTAVALRTAGEAVAVCES